MGDGSAVRGTGRDTIRGVLPGSARSFGILRGLLCGACALLWLAGCAHVEAPSGGPADLKRPQVAAVYPAPGAVDVPREAAMIFQFDEWIDRTAARNQVLVSPPYPGRTRLAIDGNRLTATLAGGAPLRANTTHVVTVLGSLRDLHENSLGRAFNLRFSTGAALDSATVEGSLDVPARRGNLLAALYITGAGARAGVSALSPRDTAFRPSALPEPWRELPAWLSAADSTGRFRADGLAAGDYALFAFEDLNGNFAFDMGFEPAATGEPSVSLRPRAPDQGLRLTPLDTMPLRIVEAVFTAEAAPKRPVASDSLAAPVPPRDTAEEFLEGAIRVRFAHAPQPARAVEAQRYRVLPDSGDPVPVRGVSYSGEKNTWLLDVPPLRANMRHRVEVRGKPDFAGRPGLDAPDTSAIFVVDRAADMQPEWNFTPVAAARSTGASGLPRLESAPARGAPQAFFSSLPLTPTRWTMLETRLEVRLMNDSVPSPLRPRREGSRTFAFDLPRPLAPGGAMVLQLRSPAGDTTGPQVLYRGSAPDTAERGGLRLLATAVPGGVVGRTFWLSAATAEADAAPQEYGLARAGDSLKAASVPAGRYRLLTFQDRDGDGVWDAGALKPWIPQEPFGTLLDTVTVTPGTVTDVTGRMKNEE